MDSPYSVDTGERCSLSSAGKQSLLCKNPGCEEKSPEFYPKNKTMCKKCVSKRNKERKEQKEQEKLKARQLSKKAEKLEAKLQKQKEKTKQIMKEVKQSQKLKAELNAGTKVLKTEGSILNTAGVENHRVGGYDAFTLTAIIASQQKMIEYQQKQADHLFALTEKILSGASTAGMDQRSGLLSSSAKLSGTGTSSSGVQAGTPWHETLVEGIIPPTPRRYPRLSHGKNRLTNDI